MATHLIDEIAARRGELLALVARYGGSNLRVFGSVAARAETPESDVDLLIDLPERVGLFQVAQLQLDLAELLRRPVDLVTPEELDPHIREHALRGALPV
ncbi:MAG TPA: nucleotidyltransferase family protein [Burkholderiales bacterium]|nr:nucleotidyltransferase family protein [Burkholderiales bacterium]